MASRKNVIATGEIYHVFNRSVAAQNIFLNSREKNRFLETIDFYRFKNPGIRYSFYNRMPIEKRAQVLDNLYSSGEDIVEIFAFSIMPNHFHLLLKQIKDSGIKIFLSQIQNSFAKFYNTKYKRHGALFQEMFKTVRIENDEQFVHVARYIHLNPVTGFILKNIDDLSTYPWTSFYSYLSSRPVSFLRIRQLLSFFSNVKKLKEFTSNQIDYQRDLDKIKHLTFDI